MDTISRINGNGQPMTHPLPLLVILTETEINDVALAHVQENTRLHFNRTPWGYEAQPEQATQIAALLMTYNFKTRYFDNWDHKNTLMLKFDHHVGFEVSSICYECCKHNHIRTTIEPGSRLAC